MSAATSYVIRRTSSAVLIRSTNGEIVPDEVREVVEDEELRQLVRIARYGPGMSRRQLGDDAL
jgi:DNA-binding transcriptional regulator YdaS (Cro superfamily)